MKHNVNLIAAINDKTLKVGSTFQFVIDQIPIIGAGSGSSGGYTYRIYGIRSITGAYCFYAFTKKALILFENQTGKNGFDTSETIKSLKNAIFTVVKMNSASIVVEVSEWKYDYTVVKRPNENYPIIEKRYRHRIPFKNNIKVEIHNIK